MILDFSIELINFLNEHSIEIFWALFFAVVFGIPFALIADHLLKGKQAKKTDNFKEKFESSYKDINSPNFSMNEKLDTIGAFSELSSEILTSEYQRELNYAKSLLDDLKIDDALSYLEKLRRDIWDRASPIVKYGILKYLGAANHKLLKNKKAGSLFIESYQYNPDTEESLFVKSLGYMLLNQREKAKEYAKKVLEKNETNPKAYSIIAETNEINDLEKIISEIPEDFRETKEVAYTIGIIARTKNNIIEAEKWLRLSKKEYNDTFPDLNGNLGEVLLIKTLEDPFFAPNDVISETKKEELREIENLLEKAWNKLPEIQMQKSRISWVSNLSTVKLLLNEYDDAKKYMDIGLTINPTDSFLEKNKGLLFLNEGKTKEAKSILKKLGTKDPQAPLILAFQLKSEGDYSKSIKILKNFVKLDSNGKIKENAYKLLMELYIITKDVNEAKMLYNSIYDSKEDITSTIFEAHISRLNGDNKKYVKLLNDAKSFITDSATPQELSMLADEFYNLENLISAAEIYEKFVDKHTNSNFTKRLIDCYYRSGNIGAAFKICQNLSEKYDKPLKYISEVEIAIYTEIGEYKEAKKLINRYLEFFPDNLDMKIDQAISNLHSNNTDDVDEFLNSPIDMKELSLEQFQKLAYLCHFRGFDEQYVDVIYNMRRNYFDEYEAHAEYVKSLIFKLKDSEFTPIKVKLGMAVCLKDNSNKKWFILEEKENPDFKLREISPDNSLCKELIGKYIGETVTIGKGISSSKVVIDEIQSKYTYASQKSVELLKYSSDNFGFESIPLGSEEETKFEPLFDVLRNRRDGIYKAEKIFKEKLIPVGTFAGFIGSNIIDAWNSIVNNPNLDLKCYSKGNNENSNVLSTANKLIIDLVSLLTIHETKTKDFVVKTFGKLGIAQSTIDEIIQALNYQKILKERGSAYSEMTPDDEVKLHDIHSKLIERNINYLEDLLVWIEHNCEVLSCRGALKINRNKRVQFNNLLSKSFMDTILIASDEGNLLYSDDGPLRLIAKEKFDVNGIWTQAVLLECLKRNNLKIDGYNKAIVKLLSFDYNSTYYNAQIIITAAEESEWISSNPYNTVINVITREHKQPEFPRFFIPLNRSEFDFRIEKDENSRLSLVKVLFLFISQLSKQSISKEQHELLMNYLISKIISRTDGHQILCDLIFLLSYTMDAKFNSLIN
ncbi:MAG: hypothetical protein ABFC34_15060 [Methanobacterium sp.]